MCTGIGRQFLLGHRRRILLVLSRIHQICFERVRWLDNLRRWRKFGHQFLRRCRLRRLRHQEFRAAEFENILATLELVIEFLSEVKNRLSKQWLRTLGVLCWCGRVAGQVLWRTCIGSCFFLNRSNRLTTSINKDHRILVTRWRDIGWGKFGPISSSGSSSKFSIISDEGYCTDNAGVGAVYLKNVDG